MTEGKYWGTLKAWGLTNPQRVTPRTFTMLDRDGETCNVADPKVLTPAERDAALAFIKMLHVRMDS